MAADHLCSLLFKIYCSLNAFYSSYDDKSYKMFIDAINFLCKANSHTYGHRKFTSHDQLGFLRQCRKLNNCVQKIVLTTMMSGLSLHYTEGFQIDLCIKT